MLDLIVFLFTLLLVFVNYAGIYFFGKSKKIEVNNDRLIANVIGDSIFFTTLFIVRLFLNKIPDKSYPVEAFDSLIGWIVLYLMLAICLVAMIFSLFRYIKHLKASLEKDFPNINNRFVTAYPYISAICIVAIGVL